MSEPPEKVTPGVALPDPYDERQPRDPDWFKRAVFYEVLVRSFFDSDADGLGDLPALGMDWTDTFSVHDLLTGASWLWGARNYVRLDPFHEPAHVLEVRRSAP